MLPLVAFILPADSMAWSALALRFCHSQNTERLSYFQCPKRLGSQLRERRTCCLWNVFECAPPVVAGECVFRKLPGVQKAWQPLSPLQVRASLLGDYVKGQGPSRWRACTIKDTAWGTQGPYLLCGAGICGDRLVGGLE